MQSIQSALFTHTAKHVSSFQEELAAAIRKAVYEDEGIRALPRSPGCAIHISLSTVWNVEKAKK